MADYIVTIRTKDGSLAERDYTANDRAELFQKLAADGVTAVRVSEGVAVKKLRKAVKKAGAPSKGRGLVAAAIVVLGAGLAVWWMMKGEEKKVEEKVVPAKEAKVKKEKIVITSTNKVEVAQADPKKLPHPAYKQPTNPKLPPKKYIPTIEEVEKARLGPDGKPRKMSIYKTPIEQAMGVIFSTELGSPPPMLPNIPAVTSEEQLVKFLENPYQFTDDTPEELKRNREMMAQVRDELRQYLGAGGDVKGFIDYYVGELHASYDQWKTAQRMVINMVRDGEDLETIRSVRDKANALLSEKGIKKLAFPPSIRRAMNEE